MTTLEFNIAIEATPEKVWDCLWQDESYRDWVAVFCEGTYAVSNWNQGEKIHFLDKNGNGMNSLIDKKIENQYMAFKHISELKNFEEQPIDDATKEWSGGMETYELTKKDNATVLTVKMGTVEKYIDYFKTTFPKGLERVKELAGNN
jgi:hypothetical protein